MARASKSRTNRPGIKKYLTEITNEHRKWIGQAAKDLNTTHTKIVQMALSRMMLQDWPKLKADLKKQQAEQRLEELNVEHEKLEQEREKLRAVIAPMPVSPEKRLDTVGVRS